MTTTDLIDPLDTEMQEFETLPMREKMLSAIADMLTLTDARMHLPVKEMFVDGMYVRELFIPKGAFLWGKLHRQECVNVCSQGSIDIVTESGSFNVSAPFTAISSPGNLKLGYAKEDTVWVNVFRTDVTDLDKIEDVIAFSNEEMRKQLDPEGKYLKSGDMLCLL